MVTLPRFAVSLAIVALPSGCLLVNSLDGYEGTRVVAPHDDGGAPPRDDAEAEAAPPGAVDFAWALTADGGAATPVAFDPFTGAGAHAVGCELAVGDALGPATDATRAPGIMTRGYPRFTGDERSQLAFYGDDGLHVVTTASTCGDASVAFTPPVRPASVARFPRLSPDGARVLFIASEGFDVYGIATVATAGTPDPTVASPPVLTDAAFRLVPPSWRDGHRMWVENTPGLLAIVVDGTTELQCGDGALFGPGRAAYQASPIPGSARVVIVSDAMNGGRRIRVVDLGVPRSPSERCPNPNPSGTVVVSNEQFAGDVSVSPDGARLAWVAQSDRNAQALAGGPSVIRVGPPVANAPFVDCPNGTTADDVAPRWLSDTVLTWTRIPRGDVPRASVIVAEVGTSCTIARTIVPPDGFTGLVGFANEGR